MAYLPNPGHLPFDCTIFDESGQETGFRQVHVRLNNGWDSKRADHAPWQSKTTIWKISRPPHPFEIKEYEVV